MDEAAKNQLKQELLDELSKEVSEQVESEVEEEVSEELAARKRYMAAVNGAKLGFIAVAATIMSLGQFSEAVTLIEDSVNRIKSEFTHSVEYDRLAKLNVGNTLAYTEDLLGNAQVSRQITGDITANYYFDDKYLLTIFEADERIAAFTVIPRVEDFNWQAIESGDKPWTLLQSNYQSYPANPQLYVIDHSKIASFYIESLETGRTGLFFNIYLGNVDLGEGRQSDQIVELYRQELNGTDEDILLAQTKLRQTAIPNFFGTGILDITLIQKGILTGAEYNNYTRE